MRLIPYRSRRLGRGVVALLAAGTTAIVGAPPASAALPRALGSAYGYYASVSLFGGPAMAQGPFVTVTLPVAGSTTPITASAPMGSVTYGPAMLFVSDAVDVSTEGASGAAASSASLQTVSNSPFSADSIQSVCNANKVAPTGGATITNGVVVTSTDVDGNPTSMMAVPTDPPVGFTIKGTLKLSATDTEKFKWVFNEHTTKANGSLEVNAAHEVLQGPTARGNLILGQSICRD
ncbi:MAG: hypothetical protein ACRDZ8_10355 [Acidimicrobiales bacterium]